MRRSRLMLVSALLTLLIIAALYLALLEPDQRRGFLADYGRNVSRLFHEPEAWAEFAQVPVRGQLELEAVAPLATAFARLDRDQNGLLQPDELGERLRTRFGVDGSSRRSISKDEFVRQIFAPNERLRKARGRPAEFGADANLAVDSVDDSLVGVGTPEGAPNPTRLRADVLFASDHVAKIEIQMSEQDWSSLRMQTRGGFEGAFENPLAKPYTKFRANILVDGVLIRDVALRKKGFIGSVDSNRPSLKVSFDDFVDQDPIEGIDRLTLNNNRQDDSLLSQSMTYWLFRKCGVHAPRCAFATVTVNGQYLGLYSHVESARKPFLRHTFGNDSGSFYEGTLTDLYSKSIEWFEPKMAERADGRSRLLQLSDLLKRDDVSIDEIGEMVEIENFLRYWAIESLISFWDGYTQNQNNFFVYDNPRDGKFYFLPWGADSCFGGRHGMWRAGNAAVGATSILANRLYHVPGGADRYRSTLESILANEWNEDLLIQEVDRLEQLILPYIDIDQIGAIAEMDAMRQFIRGRRQLVMAALRDWPIEVDSHPRTPRYDEPIGTASGSFSVAVNELNERRVGSVKGTLTLYEDSAPIAEVRAERLSDSSVAIVLAAVIRELPVNVILPFDVEQVKLDAPFEVYGQHGDEMLGSMRRGGMEPVRGEVTMNVLKAPPAVTMGGEFELRLLRSRGGMRDRRRR